MAFCASRTCSRWSSYSSGVSKVFLEPARDAKSGTLHAGVRVPSRHTEARRACSANAWLPGIRPWRECRARAGTGEHWAEKIAAEIAGVIGLPHAVVEKVPRARGPQRAAGVPRQLSISALCDAGRPRPVESSRRFSRRRRPGAARWPILAGSSACAACAACSRCPRRNSASKGCARVTTRNARGTLRTHSVPRPSSYARRPGAKLDMCPTTWLPT